MTAAILTTDQHAQLRNALEHAMEFAALACHSAKTPSAADQAHGLTMAAAEALDLLDAAALDLWALATPADATRR